MKQVNLNDNKISLVGVAHIVNNSWDQSVDYRLDTALLKPGTNTGYTFNVSESINTMKKIAKKSV